MSMYNIIKLGIINQIMKERTSKRLQQYIQLKRSIELPLKVRLYLSTLQGLINKNQSEQIAKQRVVDGLFVKSFQKANQEEKIEYLAYVLKRLQEQIQREYQENEGDFLKGGNGTINNIETTCMLEQHSFKIAFWSNCKFKFDKLKRIVNVSNKKKALLINLEQYLIRKSKKSSCTVVFQSISKDVSPQLEKICLKLKEDRFEVIFAQLFKSIGDSLAETLVHLMHESSEEPQLSDRQDQIDNAQNQKSFAFLTPVQINSYLKDKKRILDRLRVGGFSFKNILSKDFGDSTVKIDRSMKIDKIFKLQCEMDLPQKALKTEFLESVNSKFKYKVTTNILQQFSKKYRAIYEKYLIKGIPYEHICISQQSNAEGEQVYFSKGLDNLMTGNYLQFLIAKVKPSQNKQKSKLVIVASMIANKLINLEVVVAFLLEFVEMIGRSQNVQEQEEVQEAFYSIAEGFDAEDIDEIDTPQCKTERNQNIPNLFISQAKGKNHLRYRFQTSPQVGVQNYQHMRLKQHYFKGVWGRDPKGGMLCISKQMNQEQRKIVKKILASIGTTLYKMVKSGNFQNCSLPLDIFKKASHLQVIGNNLSFAPLFFDRFYKKQSIDALERFKYAILLSLSANNLGICLQKPFNPILGETLQGWIGGCPLYMQQISHHPPISSYFFEGRGYKIYGCLDPKVSLGLNSISCWGATKTTIQFEDGCKISFKFAKMIISGFIFGDRLFNYEDKTYIYDQQNNFLCIMHFGPRKKGQYKSQMHDFVYGKIVKVSEQLGRKILSSTLLIEPSKDSKCQELGELHGIWNQGIYFDNKLYINFQNDLPLAFMREEYALPSDSKYRPDLALYIQDNTKMAQEQKDILEQMQRRDRKLREKYK